MQETRSETQAALRVTFAADGQLTCHGPELTGPYCQPMPSNASAARARENTQCFICSRIYFDQSLSKCPHCNSDALQHYSTADLNHFARDPV